MLYHDKETFLLNELEKMKKDMDSIDSSDSDSTKKYYRFSTEYALRINKYINNYSDVLDLNDLKPITNMYMEYLKKCYK